MAPPRIADSTWKPFAVRLGLPAATTSSPSIDPDRNARDSGGVLQGHSASVLLTHGSPSDQAPGCLKHDPTSRPTKRSASGRHNRRSASLWTGLLVIIVTVVSVAGTSGVPIHGSGVSQSPSHPVRFPSVAVNRNLAGGQSAHGEVDQSGSPSGTLDLVNASFLPASDTFPANGVQPSAIALDSWNGNLFVTATQVASVMEVNSTSDQVVGGVVVSQAVGSYPDSLAFDARNGLLYVIDTGTSVYLVNGSTDQEIGSISLGVGNFGSFGRTAICYDSGNGDVYALTDVGSSTDLGGNVSVIDGASNTVVAQIPIPGPPGSAPLAIACDSASGDLYVISSLCPPIDCPSGSQDENVTIINTTSNSVVGLVHLGAEVGGSLGLALDSVNGDLYVINPGGSVSVLSLATGSVVTIPSPSPGTFAPVEIAFDAQNGYLYLSDSNAELAVLNGATNQYVGFISLAQPVGASQVTVDSASGLIYAPDGNDFLVAINGSTNHVVRYIPVGTVPSAGVLDSPQHQLFILDGWNVGVFNTTTGRVASWISPYLPGSGTFFAGAYDPGNGNLYLTSSQEDNCPATGCFDSVYVVNGTTDSFVTSFQLPSNIRDGHVVYDSTNSFLYDASGRNGSVAVIDGQSNTLKETFQVAGATEFEAAAFDATNGELYLVGYQPIVWAIDPTNGTVLSSIPLGYGAQVSGIAWDSRNGDLYATNSYGDNITVIDGETNTVLTSVALSEYLVNPSSISFDAQNGYLYIEGGSSTIESVALAVLNGSTNSVIGELPVVGGASYTGQEQVVADATTDHVYFPGFDSGTLSIVSTSSGSGSHSVNFNETGLAPGTSWSVDLDSVAKNTQGNSITFFESDGTYQYDIGVPSGYWVTSPTGTVTVQGASIVVPVQFLAEAPGDFLVDFSESGLASGVHWAVTLNGTSRSSTTAMIEFTEPNGTYRFMVLAVSGYSASPGSGSVAVQGNGTATYIDFTQSGNGSGAGGGSGALSRLISDFSFLGPYGFYIFLAFALLIIVGAAGAGSRRRARSRNSTPQSPGASRPTPTDRHSRSLARSSPPQSPSRARSTDSSDPGHVVPKSVPPRPHGADQRSAVSGEAAVTRGRRVSAFCTWCGEAYVSDHRFCAKCGRPRD